MKKIKFNQAEFPLYLTGDGSGFFSQWCCGCGLRHIWHFRIHKGDKKTGGSFIEINMMGDKLGTELRKFYENAKIKTLKKLKK